MEIGRCTVDKYVISVKWIYKTKQYAGGNVQRFYTTTCNTFQWNICTICAHGHSHNCAFHCYTEQMVCLSNGCKVNIYECTLEEEVYVQQPQCYEIPWQGNKLYKLKKALYGLNKDPKSCYNHIDSYLN